MAGLLLDTNAIIFFPKNSDRLSAQAYQRLRERTAQIYFSVVSAGELACLQQKDRITLNEPWKSWFRRVSHHHGWRPLEVSLDIMEEAYSLPDPIHKDPADRIIIATARIFNLEIVTTDRLILNYPQVRSFS